MPPFLGQSPHKDDWLSEVSHRTIPGLGRMTISSPGEVSPNLSMKATSVKQSKYRKELKSGGQNKWDCLTDPDENAVNAMPASVNMSIGEHAIVVNGIKYVKAERQLYQESAGLGHQAPSLDIDNDKDETTNAQSEQHEIEAKYGGDYEDQDEACTHFGDWNERWDDHGHQDHVLTEGDNMSSNSGVEDVVSTKHEGDDNDDEYHAEGTLKNPIQEPRYVMDLPKT